MKRKSNPVTLIAIVFIIGVISSFITSDFQFRSLFENGASPDLKTILDYVNLGLMFVVLVLIVIYLFYRSARRDKDRQAESWQGQDQIED